MSSSSNRSSIASDCSMQQSILPRIPVSSPLLVELLHIIFHAAERCVSVAVQALHDILHRANYELFTGKNRIEEGFVFKNDNHSDDIFKKHTSQ